MDLDATDCLAFEDSANGLRSALQAGVKTIVTVNAYTRFDQFDGALIVLDQLGEPGAAFNVLGGDAGGASRVDVPLIKQLFEAG